MEGIGRSAQCASLIDALHLSYTLLYLAESGSRAILFPFAPSSRGGNPALSTDQILSSASHCPLIKPCSGLKPALYAIFRLSLIQ